MGVRFLQQVPVNSGLFSFSSGPVEVGRDAERTHSSFPAPAIPVFIPGNSTRDKALCRLLGQRFCFSLLRVMVFRL